MSEHTGLGQKESLFAEIRDQAKQGDEAAEGGTHDVEIRLVQSRHGGGWRGIVGDRRACVNGSWTRRLLDMYVWVIGLGPGERGTLDPIQRQDCVRSVFCAVEASPFSSDGGLAVFVE